MDPQAKFSSTDPINSSPNSNFSYGGAWSRYWAYFVDGVLCGFFVFLFFDYLIFIKGESVDLNQMLTNYSWLGLIYFIVFIFYLIYFTYKKGATIGKDVYGLKAVQHTTHTPLGLPQTILRETSRNVLIAIPIIGGILYLINALMILFSKEKRGIHDRISKTQVLKVKKAWPIPKQIFLALILLVLIVPPLVADTLIKFKQKSIQREENEQQVSQTVDNEPVIEWETFTSPKYKYAIKYPKKWSILEGEHFEDIDKEKVVSFSNLNDSNWIKIQVLNQKWSEIETNPPFIKTPMVTTLAGISGIEGENALKDQKSPKVDKYIYLKHPTLEGLVLNIKVQGNNEEIINTILNSLRFD